MLKRKAGESLLVVVMHGVNYIALLITRIVVVVIFASSVSGVRQKIRQIMRDKFAG